MSCGLDTNKDKDAAVPQRHATECPPPLQSMLHLIRCSFSAPAWRSAPKLHR